MVPAISTTTTCPMPFRGRTTFRKRSAARRSTIRRTVAYSDGDRHVDTIESQYDPNDEIILTPGDDSEEVVSTADLEPQDPLLNAPHDMMDFNVPAADTADTADEE